MIFFRNSKRQIDDVDLNLEWKERENSGIVVVATVLVIGVCRKLTWEARVGNGSIQRYGPHQTHRIMSAAVDDVAPLLHLYRDRDTDRDGESSISNEIPSLVPASPSNGTDASTPNQRLASLDVFRGLTVALMILVDDAGGAFPSINHSPWLGVTLADFVMPFFLFLVGVSISLAFKQLYINQPPALVPSTTVQKIPNKTTATKKVILRAMNLFLLGLLLQGGYFHGRDHLTYGVDVGKIRWLGVLQRISIGYLLASISEIWFVNNIMVESLVDFARKYYNQWLFAIGLCFFHMCFLYGLFVPTWEYEAASLNLSRSGPGTQIVYCGVRGSLEPPCNAVGYIDRVILGEHHLYQHPVYRRTKECSVNSPDYGPLPSDSPQWCFAPFDSEGILSSLMAAVTCFVGLHFGHILLHFKVDVKHFIKVTVLLQWMGMNALIIYALGACDLFSAGLQGFYWRSPENNLVDGTEALLQGMLRSKNWGTLAFVILEILFWGLVSGFLHMKGVYIKL
ncbi:hypothetical protein DVH24_002572 [Malus domestica]|uniref:Heparan-alpha-glucosaminide N-acetyltransferase catalytic domain-containing protein n=1 Tax=Malus domestica TaxID=3750 RepID=A0A498K863_MALDO|nr:hypothetical protein DVH24_002572 [Malus domestica]